MCLDPVTLGTLATAAVSAASSPTAVLAGAALTAGGAIYSGYAQQKQADYQAKVAEENAKAENAKGAAEAEATAAKFGRLRATQRAQAAAAGVNPDAGSAALIINGDTSKNEYLDTMSTLWNSNSAATAFKNQASGYRAQGDNAMTSALIGAPASFLTTVGSARSSRQQLANG